MKTPCITIGGNNDPFLGNLDAAPCAISLPAQSGCIGPTAPDGYPPQQWDVSSILEIENRIGVYLFRASGVRDG